MMCRDVAEEYDAITYTESADKLYCIHTDSSELTYKFQENKLLLSFSILSPHYFYNNNDKEQLIELAVNDVAKVKTILEQIFIPVSSIN